MKDKQIPEQKNGGLHDTENEKCFSSEIEAIDKFKILKNRFFNVNHWQSFAGDMSASFQLHDVSGKAIDRPPEVGDFVEINIPGPGNISGDGADWVKIVEVNDNPMQPEYDERCFMRFRPSQNPTADEIEDEEIAHFYSEKASSNFLIYRKGHCVYAQIHGRNEVNNTNTDKLPDKIRNAIVGFAGRIGAGKIQWKLLTTGFLNLDEH